MAKKPQEERREPIGSQPHHGVDRSHDVVKTMLPLIVLVLAFTAIPVELRPMDSATLSWDSGPLDLIANIIGYVPVGMVMATAKLGQAVAIAASLSVAAETSQLFSVHRFASVTDAVLNIAGASIGWFLMRAVRLVVPPIPVNNVTARISIIVAVAILGLKGWSDRELISEKRSKDNFIVNSRGATTPGSLEGRWMFDDLGGGAVADSSGSGLTGMAQKSVEPVEGVQGTAIRLDGVKGDVDLGNPVELRLMGSLTIAAWINSTAFPVDDAAIVSAQAPGYQLDTTIDQGPRTVGFKLTDLCGNLMARYGRTDLVPNKWYHAAGVYDADALTLHVFLNGQEDDGVLGGRVAPVQQASGEHVYIGKRPNPLGYGFIGLVDDVQIYSRALKQGQIEAVMRGGKVGDSRPSKIEPMIAGEIQDKRLSSLARNCYQPTRDVDAAIPGVMVVLGMLSAIAWAGFRSINKVGLLTVGLVTGTLLVPLAARVALPTYVLWMIPLLTLIGAVSIALSLERRTL